MAPYTQSRDYSLVGLETRLAERKGLASAEWYHLDIPRKRMKELMQRKNGPAIRDTLIWFSALGGFGFLGAYFWGSWLALPFFAIYGVLYGSTSDSRWHECGHGTAFRTRWMNDVVYQIASFMIMREPTVWRWSHTRHHTDTLIVGRDPEIVAMRPPRLVRILLNFFGIVDVPVALAKFVLHAVGRLTAEENTFVPETEQHRVYRTARIWLAIYAAVAASCIALGSILPAMLVGLPRLYGTWLHLVFGLTQHGGLAEDVLDHRLNSRTVYMNPVLRFLYWNMNYHIEHHLLPMVPYHALPALHAEIKDDCPPASNGLWESYREIVPALLRQMRDPTHFVRRRLPAGARPYIESAGVAAE
ncbi:MAG: fatty acid desaturase family protein [Alphaproteobacteria bacterium]